MGVAVLLIFVGLACFLASTKGFGDIGLSFAVIGVVSVLSGIGLFMASRKNKWKGGYSMKRFFSILLCLLLLSVPALAEVDLSGMSKDELISVIASAHSRLLELGYYNSSDLPLLDQDGVKVTLHEMKLENGHLNMNCTVENNSSIPATITLDDISINGWMVMFGAGVSVEPYKKAKGVLTIYNVERDAEVTSSDKIDEMSFSLFVRNYDDGFKVVIEKDISLAF